MEEVEDSSSPATSSWGLEAVGVVDGDTLSDDDRFMAAELDEKLRNIASILSALEGFWRALISFVDARLVLIKSETLELNAQGIAKSELVSESLPWLLDVLFGDLREKILESFLVTKLGGGVTVFLAAKSKNQSINMNTAIPQPPHVLPGHN